LVERVLGISDARKGFVEEKAPKTAGGLLLLLVAGIGIGIGLLLVIGGKGEYETGEKSGLGPLIMFKKGFDVGEEEGEGCGGAGVGGRAVVSTKGSGGAVGVGRTG